MNWSKIFPTLTVVTIFFDLDFGQFTLQLGLLLRCPLAVDMLEKVKTDAHVVDAGQFGHVLDVVYIVVDVRLFLVRADQHRIHPHHATPLANGADVVITAIALNIVKSTRVGVRDHQRTLAESEDIFHARRVKMRQIDEDAQRLTRFDHFLAEVS